jgi:hypothetical protein
VQYYSLFLIENLFRIGNKALKSTEYSFFFLSRWGNIPLDEEKRCGRKPPLEILEKATEEHLTATRN